MDRGNETSKKATLPLKDHWTLGTYEFRLDDDHYESAGRLDNFQQLAEPAAACDT